MAEHLITNISEPSFLQRARPVPSKHHTDLSRSLAVALVHVAAILFGPYSETFRKAAISPPPVDHSPLLDQNDATPRTARRTELTRAAWRCFSLSLHGGKCIDLVAEDEGSFVQWMLGLQQQLLLNASQVDRTLVWNHPKLRLQKLRLKLISLSAETGTPRVTVLAAATRGDLDEHRHKAAFVQGRIQASQVSRSQHPRRKPSVAASSSSPLGEHNRASRSSSQGELPEDATEVLQSV